MVELEARQKAAMVPFAELAGIWRGTTVETRPDGTRERTIAAHRGGPMLDGKTMVLEGRSYREDGSVAFNLMAVISFDPAKGTYEFRAYGRGHVVTIAVHPTPTGYYFERPEPVTGATLRYTVELGGGRWREKGVRMVPGKAAVTVLETDMTRVGTTDWPAGGAVGFRQP
ncbi:MAG: DUF1579 domain-containing protein [Brevundimonas sp.]|nr:MAG: DUF1579 domain-containing protein [Brevundimonas sp.]